VIYGFVATQLISPSAVMGDVSMSMSDSVYVIHIIAINIQNLGRPVKNVKNSGIQKVMKNILTIPSQNFRIKHEVHFVGKENSGFMGFLDSLYLI